jgi:hypothetical protein
MAPHYSSLKCLSSLKLACHAGVFTVISHPTMGLRLVGNGLILWLCLPVCPQSAWLSSVAVTLASLPPPWRTRVGAAGRFLVSSVAFLLLHVLQLFCYLCRDSWCSFPLSVFRRLSFSLLLPQLFSFTEPNGGAPTPILPLPTLRVLNYFAFLSPMNTFYKVAIIVYEQLFIFCFLKLDIMLPTSFMPPHSLKNHNFKRLLNTVLGISCTLKFLTTRSNSVTLNVPETPPALT